MKNAHQYSSSSMLEVLVQTNSGSAGPDSALYFNEKKKKDNDLGGYYSCRTAVPNLWAADRFLSVAHLVLDHTETCMTLFYLLSETN